MKYKKCITITNAFQEILDESGCKPNRTWVDQRSKFYNRSMKSWLDDNGIEMYSTRSEWKSVVVERFIRILKKKNLEIMKSLLKNMHTDKLTGVV